uniref:Endonuclease/exonuclease/phosphatase domain-containing protein n=1 Tax=Cyprinus carpio carpio TaxID=630221 RepID=A0A9J7ZYM8_CYPCA
MTGFLKMLEENNSRGTAIIINKSIPFITSDVISDPNGRYIIVTGELYYTPVTLANIFAPNYDDEKFVDSVLAILPNLHSHDLILAGDFNLVMDTVLDRSSNRQQSVSKSYLAHQIKVSSEICIGSGCITKDQLEINQVFFSWMTALIIWIFFQLMKEIKSY